MALYTYLQSTRVTPFVEQGFVPLREGRAERQQPVLLFGASRSCAPDLAARFGADAIVEIYDEARFLARFEAAVRRSRHLNPSTFQHRDVEYYDERQTPSWLVPEQALFAEPLASAVEFEHRCVVRRRVGSAPASGAKARRRARAPMLRLGYLGDCCRVVTRGVQAC